MATYVNDLRLKEIATGDEAGTWGTSTNTNLELIGEALGYGTQDCFSSNADATTTVADGTTDPARAMYFKVTSSATLTATRTLTIAPNTISRVMFIENATTGSQSITISQGSGANVTIATGKTAVVYLDGAGSGAAVVDAMALVDPGITDTLAEVLVAGNTSGANNLIIDNGQAITTNTINETTAASGVTIDSVLLKDDGVNATNLEITNLKANDGTAAGSIANSTGVVTLASSVLTTTDINGGTIDGTVIGGSTAAAITGTTITGTSFASSGNMTFGDNDKAIFGAGSDLQIYHTSTYSAITDVGTGELYIGGDGFVDIGNAALSLTRARFSDSTSALYQQGSIKLATTSTGIDVTGTVTADGLTVDGLTQLNTNNLSNGLTISGNDNANVKVRFDNTGTSGGDFVIQGGIAGASNEGLSIRDLDNSAQRIHINPGGDILFYEDTGTTAKFFWDSSAESLGIGTSSPSNTVTITNGSSGATEANGSIVPLMIENSSSAYINFLTPNNANAGFLFSDPEGNNVGQMQYLHGSDALVFATNASERMRIDSSGNVGIGTDSPDNKLHVYKGANGHSWSFDAGDAFIVENNDSVSINLATPSANSANILFSDADARGQGRIVYAHGSDYMGFHTAGIGNERMRIDSSGNVGINTSSPAYNAHIKQSASYGFGVESPSDDSRLLFGNVSSSWRIAATYDTGGSFQPITFFTSDTERMRIDASGQLLIGVTSLPSAGSGGAGFRADSNGRRNLYLSTTATTSNDLIIFNNPNGTVGNIIVNGTSTSYNTSSDYRLKENVVPLTGATERVKQLNPSRFNFIADADTTVDGFLAHEVADVVPEAITGTKDAMRDEEYEVTPAVLDDDGNVVTEAVMGTHSVPDYQGIDQSKLVPLLVATIQELEARITALESN